MRGEQRGIQSSSSYLISVNSSRLPGWYWLWIAAHLVFANVCVSVCAFMPFVALINRKCLMWLSLPKAPCCRVQHFSHFFCYTFHSLTVPHLGFFPLSFSFHYPCSLSALARELWMWSPAACCIADRDDEHTDLSPRIQTQLKRKKETFQPCRPESFFLGFAGN